MLIYLVYYLDSSNFPLLKCNKKKVIFSFETSHPRVFLHMEFDFRHEDLASKGTIYTTLKF